MGDYAIQMQFDIDADQATIHRALTTESGIRSWWSKRSDGPTNGELRVNFPDVPVPFEFTVARDDADRVEWVTGAFPPPWAGTSMAWELSANPDKPGSRLLFSHLGFDADSSTIAIVTPAWAQIIMRLKGYAETGTAQPFFDF